MVSGRRFGRSEEAGSDRVTATTIDKDFRQQSQQALRKED